jgi:hypothetical protein
MKIHNENGSDDLDDLLPEDLRGDIVPEIDPKKLFDEKEYSTIILGSEGMSKKDANNADLLATLISNKSTREEKDYALLRLKENNAQDFIVTAISKTKKPELKAQIVAACWETGLDFSKHFPFFIDLVASSEFTVSFEAVTVIQEMETEIDPVVLQQSLDKLLLVKNPNVCVNDAMEHIRQKLNLS